MDDRVLGVWNPEELNENPGFEEFQWKKGKHREQESPSEQESLPD